MTARAARISQLRTSVSDFFSLQDKPLFNEQGEMALSKRAKCALVGVGVSPGVSMCISPPGRNVVMAPLAMFVTLAALILAATLSEKYKSLKERDAIEIRPWPRIRTALRQKQNLQLLFIPTFFMALTIVSVNGIQARNAREQAEWAARPQIDPDAKVSMTTRDYYCESHRRGYLPVGGRAIRCGPR